MLKRHGYHSLVPKQGGKIDNGVLDLENCLLGSGSNNRFE